jgi:hypothetical protein
MTREPDRQVGPLCLTGSPVFVWRIHVPTDDAVGRQEGLTASATIRLEGRGLKARLWLG